MNNDHNRFRFRKPDYEIIQIYISQVYKATPNSVFVLNGICIIFTVYLKVLLCYKAADVWQLEGRLIRRKEW